jgi:polyhydroxyalkanoate synthase
VPDHAVPLANLPSRLLDAAWDLRARPRRVIAPTPYRTLAHDDLLEVRHFHRPGGPAPRHATPVLLVPPLMARSFIFDLRHGRSMVEHLLDEGFDVYLVDWGKPQPRHRGLTLEDYALRWLDRATATVAAAAGRREVAMVGYCLGGLFSLWNVAASASPRAASLALIAAPTDAFGMGPLAALSRRLSLPIEALGLAIGNVPGALSSLVFQGTTPWRSVARWAEVWSHLDDEPWLDDFAAMNAWMGSFTALPQRLFLQLFRDLIRDNRMLRGTMRLGGRAVDLQRVQVPLLAFAGADDRVVGAASVRAIAAAVGSHDVRVVVAPGGHAGVIAGHHAPTHVWTPLSRWLADHDAR